MTMSPGCGASYFLYTSLGVVPAGWKATYTSDPNGAGTDYSNIDNVACGNGNVVIKAYLVVTAPQQCMEGDTVTITTMLGADDNARNDKDLVYAKCTVKIHIPHPLPLVANPVASFSIPEDTTDDTHINLTSVFRNEDKDPMSGINMGYYLTCALAVVFFYIATTTMFEDEWKYFFGAGVIGIALSIVIVYITQYLIKVFMGKVVFTSGLKNKTRSYQRNQSYQRMP